MLNYVKFVYWCVVALVGISGCVGAQSANPTLELKTGNAPRVPVWVNPERAKLASASADTTPAHLAQAISANAQLLKQDPNNAMNWYVAAGLAGIKGDWQRAAAMIQAGNAKPAIYEYQVTSYAVRALPRSQPALSGLHGLYKTSASIVQKKSVAMLMRAVANRIVHCEPLMESSLFSASALQIAADLALRRVDRDRGNDFAQRDQAFSDLLDKTVNDPSYQTAGALIKKYNLPKVTRDMGPTTFDPDVAQRLLQASDEYETQCDRVLRPLVDRMPK